MSCFYKMSEMEKATEEKNTEEKYAAEHFDGTTFKDLYPEERNDNWDHSRGSVKNLSTRIYLQRVREIRNSIDLLGRRVQYRLDAGLDAGDLYKQITDKHEELKAVTAEIADEISKIGNVGQEMVLTMRYIDLKTWDEIAEAMDLRVKTVLKFHGYGLAHMRDVLAGDGLIGEEDDEQVYSS